MSKVPQFRTVIVALLLMLAGAAAAQQTDGLTVELIDQRIATFKEGGVADDNETLQAYGQARTLLNQADAFGRDEAGYVAALTSAPEQQAEIQARIDQLDSVYDPAPELAGLTPEELTTRLALGRAEQRDLSAQLESLNRRLSTRETVATDLRARLTAIGEQAAALSSLPLTLDASAAPSLAEANEWRAAAEARTLNSERRAQQAQLASQPVRYGAMAAERAELALKLERLSLLIKEMETRSTASVQPIVEPGALDIAATDPAFALAVSLAEDDAALRQQQVSINERLADIRERNDEIKRRSQALEDRYATARRIVEFAGDSDTQGQVLLTYWEEIGDFVMKDPSNQLMREAGGTVIGRIKHEETLSQLVSASGFVNQRLRETGVDPESIPLRTQSTLQELTRGYRERLRAVITDESDYIDALSELNSGYSALKQRVAEYRSYLEGLILWIPNHPPLWAIDPGSMGALLGAWWDNVTATVKTLNISPGLGLALAVLGALLLFLYRGRLVALQQTLNSKILRPREDSIRFTVFAMGAGALRAAPLPILFQGLGSTIEATASPVAEYMVALFSNLAVIVFFVNLLRIVSEPSGIGQVHFNWRTVPMARLHDQLTFMVVWWMPLAVAAAVANRLAPLAGDEAVARILILLALVILVYRLIGYEIREMRMAGAAWFGDTLNRLRLLLTTALVILAVQTVYGQVFTVTVVVQSMLDTIWIGTGLLLIHAMLMRWLRVAQRHLRLNELLAHRVAQTTSEDGVSAEEQVPDLGDISSETRQLATTVTMAVAAVAILYTWSPLLPAFEILGQVDLWTSTAIVDGEIVPIQITLATLLSVAVLAALTLFAARRLPAVMEMSLRSRTSVSPGARYTASALFNYLIIGAGIIAALGALGLRWDQLQWLVAALGVGIGFGLQEIVANFISGLIILFERPIRVGDIVTVGDCDGTVTKIRIRATTIRDWDGKELLVPNKEFITARLLNWTLSDSHTRVTINVGIAYGSNVEKALEILKEVTLEHPRTVREPAPLIVFENFGDNALELSARSFIDSLEGRLQVTTELRQEINRRFEEAGIVIAFPQRDVHVDTAGPIRIALDPSPDA